MSDVEVSVIATAEEMAAALAVRSRVFTVAQGDDYDADPASNTRAVHVLARLDGEAVATARLLLDVPAGGNGRLERVAVLGGYRGRHLGEVVAEALHEEARRRDFAGVVVSAQSQVMPFYARMGYVAEGPAYLESGSEHRTMVLRFDQPVRPH